MLEVSRKYLSLHRNDVCKDTQFRLYLTRTGDTHRRKKEFNLFLIAGSIQKVRLCKFWNDEELSKIAPVSQGYIYFFKVLNYLSIDYGKIKQLSNEKNPLVLSDS